MFSATSVFTFAFVVHIHIPKIKRLLKTPIKHAIATTL
ncbi:hypothetical protein IMCC1989_514 [gamma proteobacterium IMCC1989]|nr:hypothetical protein IMCC1989_514 [gamma proteobacterium IMCC1989]